MPRPPGTHRPPKHELSPHKRALICSACQLGATLNKIANTLGENRETVRMTVQRASRRVSCITQPRNGRPSKLTAHDKRRLIRVINNNPKIIQRELHLECVPHVSKRTLQRYLRTLNISKWKARKQSLLTPEIAAALLRWAQEYVNWSVDQWKCVRWSDECSIERGSGARAEWIFR